MQNYINRRNLQNQSKSIIDEKIKSENFSIAVEILETGISGGLGFCEATALENTWIIKLKNEGHELLNRTNTKKRDTAENQFIGRVILIARVILSA